MQKDQKISENELYTMGELTARLKSSRETIYGWIAKGLPVIKSGRRRFFSGESVIAFLKSMEERALAGATNHDDL